MAFASLLKPTRVLGANDRIRVAIVGAGDRMMNALVPSFLGQAGALNFDLVAVCDIWSKRREEVPAVIAKKYNIKEPAKVRNTTELYAMKDVDAVMIATADFQHAQHAI
jgi:predicted dehydrogenase